MRTRIVLLVVLSVFGKSSAQWVKLGLAGIRVNCFLVDGSNLYAGTSSGVFVSTDHGSSWNTCNNGLSDTNVTCLASSGSGLFAGADTSIFLTINGGSTWGATAFPGTYSTIYGTGYHNVYALMARGPNLFCGAYGYLGTKFLTSTDNGSTWTAHVGPPSVGSINALCFSGTNLLAGTEGGISVSADTGSSFSTTTADPANPVSAFAQVGGVTFAAAQSGVYLSTDNGSSWSPSNSGLTDTSVNALATDSTDLFAGTSGGVFWSINNGATWTKVSTDLSDSTVYSLLIDGGNLYAGTNAGVWVRPLPQRSSSVGLVHVSLPKEFTLSQNFPNPFNPTTTIEFTLEQNGRAVVRVFNILGQEVATVFDEEAEAGRIYEARFDAARLASGVYVSVLESGGKRLSRKMVLMK